MLNVVRQQANLPMRAFNPAPDWTSSLSVWLNSVTCYSSDVSSPEGDRLIDFRNRGPPIENVLNVYMLRHHAADELCD